LISAEVVEIKKDDHLVIKVIQGGKLTSNKGINLPDCLVSAPAFTEKDREDLMFGLKHGIDYIALSFVREKKDVQQVRYLLHKLKKDPPIISKIEKPQAIDNIDEIIEVSDFIMIARGDMGVELGNHLVPAVQKDIINRCNMAKKPVITATQMLESMTDSPTPTRAEASDVANAIWDGSDAVMLSGETAAGKFPFEAVRMMSNIIVEAEKKPKERPLLRNIDLSEINTSVMVAASMVAEKVRARFILAMTESGASCLKVSQFRPSVEVLGLTRHITTARRMCLYWGVRPYLLQKFEADHFSVQRDLLTHLEERLKLQNGDKVVITRGDGKLFTQGSSNSVKVELIKNAPKVLGSSDVLLEGKDEKKRILLDTSLCASCHNCISTCPHDIFAIGLNEKGMTVIEQNNVGDCTIDYECVRVCPTGAIEIIATE
jgi:pyruvate kinase